MKIAIVTRNMGSGGAERVIAQLIKGWTEMGVQCSLICMHPAESFYNISDNVHRYDVPKCAENPNIDKIFRYKYLRKVITEISPDIVLALPEEIGIYVIPAMFGSGIPVVVSERNNPWVMPYKKISRILRQLVYPFAAGLIFQTEQAASFFSNAQQEKGIVLPNPLDCSRLPDVYEGEREKTVVSAGRMDSQKNFPLLINAFAKFYEDHPNYKLVIYGEGVERAKLEELAVQKLKDGCWSMPGRVNDLPARIGKCEIFALSSDYEGVPNVLIEAMAVGTPAVSTDCAPGGAATLIQSGENGLIVPVQDVDALADGLSFIADHPEKSAAMAAKAVEIRHKLDAETVCGQWMDYLKKVSEEHKCKQNGIQLTLNNLSFDLQYQRILIVMFTMLSLLSGWALVQSDSTMATPFTLLLNRLITYVCVFGIASVYFLSPKQISTQFKHLLFAPLLYWFMYYFLRFDTSLPFNITSMIVLCLFCLLNAENKRLIYQSFRKAMIALCAVGVVCYGIYLLNIDALFTRYDYYSASLGGEYISYGVGSMCLIGNQLRLCGHFNEPGFLGTVLALMLCIENLNFKKMGNMILLVAGCLTLSMAFYAIVAIYIAIRLTPIIIKKPVLIVGVLAVIPFYLFVFPHIRTGNAGIDRLIQRFALTANGLAGNNRENYMLNYLYDEVVKGRDFLIGKGAGFVNSLDIGSVGSYKKYIVEYGLVGFALIYGSTIVGALLNSQKNVRAIAMITVFTISIYQRPDIISLVYFVLLYGGVEHIVFRDKVESKVMAKKKVKS